METVVNHYTLQGNLINSWIAYEDTLGYVCSLILKTESNIYLIKVSEKNLREEIIKCEYGCLVIIGGYLHITNDEIHLFASEISILED